MRSSKPVMESTCCGTRDVGNDGADRRNPYFVTVDLLSETDDNEPNETPVAATALTDGQAVSLMNVGVETFN